MEILKYYYDNKGNLEALFLDLKFKDQLSSEQIEDIEDIISYELSKDEPNLDYDEEIAKIIGN